MLLDVPALMGPPVVRSAPAFLVSEADRRDLDAYRRLRHDAFVEEQGIFAGTDLDALDEDPRTVVLVARAAGQVVGGVRLAPVGARDIGWWTGSRLVVAPGARGIRGVGSALVRAAAVHAEQAGVLRFDATVQARSAVLFERLGWIPTGAAVVGGVDHVTMRWPIGRIQDLVDQTKAHLAAVLEPGVSGDPDVLGAALGGPGWVGDDGAPVPGTDVIAACDAILPSMVERDPEWAGWCGVLVNVNDLSAMGATPLGLLDSVAGRDAASVRRVMAGVRRGAAAWGIPVLGGHTQLGVPAALSVTALGRTADPVPGGGGSAGQALSLTVDLSGSWRSGHRGAQWNSTEGRSPAELRDLAATVARARPAAAKDVSMAGIVGTAGMLAEASGMGAVVDVADVPVPGSADVAMGDWLTCFPGFGMLTADAPGASRMASPHATTAGIGRLTAEPGVGLRWPDGVVTPAVAAGVTGLGAA
ncbi:putative N-acetyltransferase (TIGR04045 family) [Clavibacter michiganensis]|uniref:MSMEG_0567/sll0787 family protein n=1 Tax=Clavibacter michiganensis TaxID=28447 RepID=UPI001DF69355|nr:MSMEG_0567/sll0787 family protein [Clavibacter michiganensis]MBP2456994.1 putative N-acetyltransferase (TIGR04045 family) [Clavibacter michiganensis]MDQ0409564.1 putative N-acetyltransferase (TIGR04045 family) [Clavibacter michiganensis]